jgi:Holliday junction resolvasome RuvABC endonuclease subunit
VRILAIDPSLRSTGLAGVGWCESLTNKLTGHERLRLIKYSVRDYALGADMAVMEGPAYGAKGRSVHQLAGVWWIVAHQLWRMGVPYAVVDPRSLKIYATNNGNASKEEVAQAMSDLHPTMTFETNDESDAYTLLTMAHQYYQIEMTCCGADHHYPDHNRVGQALGNVEWPVWSFASDGAA